MAAADYLPKFAKRVFLTTGIRGLEAFSGLKDLWFLVRLIDKPETPPALESYQVIAGRAPYSLEDERAILAEHSIDALVAKNAGGSATEAKIFAAAEAGIEPAVVEIGPAQDTPYQNQRRSGDAGGFDLGSDIAKGAPDKLLVRPANPVGDDDRAVFAVMGHKIADHGGQIVDRQVNGQGGAALPQSLEVFAVGHVRTAHRGAGQNYCLADVGQGQFRAQGGSGSRIGRNAGGYVVGDA